MNDDNKISIALLLQLGNALHSANRVCLMAQGNAAWAAYQETSTAMAALNVELSRHGIELMRLPEENCKKEAA